MLAPPYLQDTTPTVYGGAQGLPNEPANFDWSTIDPNRQMRGFNPDGTPNYVSAMPSYDAQHDPYQGAWNFNDTTQNWDWTPNGDAYNHATGAVTAPGPTGGTTGGGSGLGPTDWAGLQTSIFGTMPSVVKATPPPFSYDPFVAPDPFAPPTGQSVLDADPGFTFRMGQGRQAMEQGAAARGALNTGGTLQDLIDYGQKAASQEYGNAYDRALGTYQTNFSNKLNSYLTNFGNALTKYNTNYGTQYLTPFNQLMSQYGLGMQGQNQLFGQQFASATA